MTVDALRHLFTGKNNDLNAQIGIHHAGHVAAFFVCICGYTDVQVPNQRLRPIPAEPLPIE